MTTTIREIEETTARCVSITVFRHNSPRDHYRAEVMFEDDVRSIARWVAAAGLGEREVERKLFEPLRSELVARYGVEIGSKLHAEFLATYRDAWRSERPTDSTPINSSSNPPVRVSGVPLHA